MLREHDRRVLVYGSLILAGVWLSWSEDFNSVRDTLLIYIGITVAVSVAVPAWQALHPSRVSFGDKALQVMKAQGVAVSPEAAELVKRMPNPPLVETPTLLGTAIRLGRRFRSWRDKPQP
jgi:hypothetical protein